MGYQERKTIVGLAALIGIMAGPVWAENLTTPFNFDWNGVPLGRATLEYQAGPGMYESRLEGSSQGLGGIFAPLVTTTIARGGVSGPELSPTSYDTDYKLRVKQKATHLRWSGGKLSSEKIIPPVEETANRPKVPAADKAGAVDPLSGFWQLRAWLMPGGALANPGMSHAIKIWDGKRLFTLNATHVKTGFWRHSGPPMQASIIRVKRTALAGFKPEEQAAINAGREPEMVFYFCAESNPATCDNREPVGLELPSMLGTIRAAKDARVAAPVEGVGSAPLAAPVAPAQIQPATPDLNTQPSAPITYQ